MPARGLGGAALAYLRDALAPGGRVLRVRPLHGGVSSSVHVVHLKAASGARQAVIVRRYGAYAQREDPSAGEREFKLLSILTRLRQPVPAPLLLEPAGGPFGTPTIVMSRVPGRPLLSPRKREDFFQQTADALLRLHTLPIDELGFLPDQRVVDVEPALQPTREPPRDPLEAALRDAARRHWSRVKSLDQRRALLHGDYWPGNLLWRRGRLEGIVDWEQPRLGDPTRDVATCRGDLSILFGLPAADAFLQCYTAAGGQVDNLAFWDLLICTWAVPHIVAWAEAYPRLGRPDLTPALASQRIREFAARALES
ncbi:MAG: phosphotransferase [Chloroflexi bacterium]|nr:phosphotransferase [Chloroflexota bacterium]